VRGSPNSTEKGQSQLGLLVRLVGQDFRVEFRTSDHGDGDHGDGAPAF